jgi:hypothetical protein
MGRGEGPGVTGAGSAVWDLLTGGSALAALGKVSIAVCALVLGLIYRRYVLLLGADRRKPAERQAYDALRESPAEGNIAARLYAERLTRFLDWVERFFGDAGMADRTLFPHAFGLRNPAPLWTAPALDRCLLLALFYPILTIFVIWAVTGHVGPAEASLRLNPNLPAWQRAGAAMALGCSLFISRRSRQSPWKVRLQMGIGHLVALAVAAACGAGLITNAAALTFATVGFDVATGSGTGTVFGAVSATVTPTIATSIAFSRGLAFAIAVASAVVVVAVAVGVVVARLSTLAIRRQRQGAFIAAWFAIIVPTCLGAAYFSTPDEVWKMFGALVLFLGLLSLLNAPFDWASLGLTRALLRRGLELGAWWPYALALVDAALAAGVIAALALTMVVGVQAFDALAVRGGGAAVLPLEPLFSGIVEHPSAPEYWWLYALLLSTTIPSLVNLVIGGTSLVRGLPGVPSLLLRYIPEGGGVLKWDRHWIATLLTAQVATGAALGIAAQVFLVVVIIGYVMPFFGLELLDMARDVADFNLPARVGQLFGVSL